MPSTPSRRALIVEDDPAIGGLLRLHLELAGFTLDETGNGRQALDLASTATFDLILLDVMFRGSTASVSHDPEMLLTAWGVGYKVRRPRLTEGLRPSDSPHALSRAASLALSVRVARWPEGDADF